MWLNWERYDKRALKVGGLFPNDSMEERLDLFFFAIGFLFLSRLQLNSLP